MPYQTDERLKSYLDTNQLHREQLCRSVLATDKRFSDVRPRHPRGGPDRGRDIQAIYREDQIAFGAVGFVNQANDSEEQKRAIKNKFSNDLRNAISAENKLKAFVFFTNINLTIGEKEELIIKAKTDGILYCDILDRERIRIILDSPDGLSIRFQYLNISLSEEEQASFFARWGDDIQSVISSGFQKIEGTLNRLLFLHEANDPILHLTISIELHKKYTAEEIGHFRLFCYLTLKEPKHEILSLLFGSSDKSNRMRGDNAADSTKQKPGIKYGIGSGQWEHCIDIKNNQDELLEDEEDEHWFKVGSASSIGRDEIEFISISYNKDSFIRICPVICLRDLDNSIFILFSNKLLAEKIKAIHIYSNGYKLQEIGEGEINIDTTDINPNFPVKFDENELEDKWVRIRPKVASAYHLRFFDQTPRRLYSPSLAPDSLEDRRKNV